MGSNQETACKAIGCYHEVLHLHPSDRPDYCMSLPNLANALFARYDYSRTMREAMICYMEAPASCPLATQGVSTVWPTGVPLLKEAGEAS